MLFNRRGRRSNRSNCANRADATMVNRPANVRPKLPTSRSNQEARGSMRILRLPLSAVHSPIAPFSPLRELRCARRDSCFPQEVFSPPHYWRLLVAAVRHAGHPTPGTAKQAVFGAMWQLSSSFLRCTRFHRKHPKSAGLAQLLHRHFVTVLKDTFRTEIIGHLRNLLLRPLHSRQLTVELLH
jgi:hypothetical protein